MLNNSNNLQKKGWVPAIDPDVPDFWKDLKTGEGRDFSVLFTTKFRAYAGVMPDLIRGS